MKVYFFFFITEKSPQRKKIFLLYNPYFIVFQWYNNIPQGINNTPLVLLFKIMIFHYT